MSEHSSRKADHLDLCATDQVAFHGKTTLFDDLDLLHDALPELALSEIELSTPLLGKTLRAPLVIAAMTGGVDRAERINRDLASVAEEHGLAFGFGSMRPLLEHGVRDGYFVREDAPNALIFANVGVVQARKTSTAALQDLVGSTGCDALVVHLNPAMEVIQPGGDDDFRGGIDTLARLRAELGVPVVVKETGCGLSRSVGQRVRSLGITTVDTSGAGGTSWVGVETLRAKARTRGLGERFWDWGIPTAGSVAQLSGLDLDIIATGGVRHGIDIVKAVALGAKAGGLARPFLMAWNEGGRAFAADKAAEIIDEIRLATLLSGARTLSDLREKPLLVGTALRRWIPAGTPLAARL